MLDTSTSQQAFSGGPLQQHAVSTVIRVLIVDAHPLFRRGLAEILRAEPGMLVRGEAGDARSALECIRSPEPPDVVVLDVNLPGEGAFHLVEKFSAHCRTIVTSFREERWYAERMRSAGACAYLAKSDSVEQLLSVIRAAHAGKLDFRSIIRFRSSENGSPLRELSNREIEIFELIGQGVPVRTIAKRLSVSPKTVEAHRENLKRKFRLGSSAELMIRAVGWALQRGQPDGEVPPETSS